MLSALHALQIAPSSVARADSIKVGTRHPGDACRRHSAAGHRCCGRFYRITAGGACTCVTVKVSKPTRESAHRHHAQPLPAHPRATSAHSHLLQCDSHCRRGRPATTSTRPIDVYIFFELYPTVNVLTVYSASPTTRRSVQIKAESKQIP